MRCAICYTKIAEGEADTQCDSCTQVYHQRCWEDIGGCGTYGCEHAAVAEKPTPPTSVSLGWGDSKQCPRCDDEIAASLLLCTCGARFPYADPMTESEYRGWLAEQSAIAKAKRWLTVLFVISLAGVVAPLSGTIAGVYAYLKRRLLEGENGTYLAIGYGSATIGGVYALVGLLLALGL